MDIIKLYHATWQKVLYNQADNEQRKQWINYYVLYRRIEHTKYQQVNTVNNFINKIEYSDEIDMKIFNSLNEKLKEIPAIENFNSIIYDSQPFGYPEQLEMARLSKSAIGYKFRNLILNNLDSNISLATRVFSFDFKNVKDGIIYDLPASIVIDTEDLSSISREEFLSISQAEDIIAQFWQDRDTDYSN